MSLSSLTAISPLDGRYFEKMVGLSTYTSEAGLMRYRLHIEICWLEALANNHKITEVPAFTATVKTYFQALLNNFSLADAQAIKAIEATTNHDVKAIEYFLKKKCEENTACHHYLEFIHFACTSEDINNLSYALMIRDVKENILAPTLNKLIDTLTTFANAYADLSMLSRTHGQTASPTTLGKEFANVAARLKRQVLGFNTLEVLGKINGATGNFNAHAITYPEVNWQAFSKQFVESLGLVYNAHTTQIEPHDFIAEHCHALARINTVLLDVVRDIWGYVSLNYFTQKTKEGEIGSSTMPHKINPIDFENAEGNLGLANALLEHFAAKLPISRWQRDLSDSTVLRNLGVALAHSELSYQSILKGLNKLQVNNTVILSDLDTHWEVLGEALQTIMRRYGISQPYEKLKALTRGKKIDKAALHDFIRSLELPQDVKHALLELTPHSYIGYAATLAKLA